MTSKKTESAIRALRSHADARNIEGMARYGIVSQCVLGIPMPTIKALAKELGKDHDLAEELWQSGIYEARILAAMVDDPKKVTREQMERWVLDFDNWGLCDGVCNWLFDRTSHAWEVIPDWCCREEEYVKRAGFVLIAQRSVHDKKAEDERFMALLPLTEEGAKDERPMVRKAVNWALRQVGKRNIHLNTVAVEEAKKIAAIGSKGARWIASDALRELQSESIILRLRGRAPRQQ